MLAFIAILGFANGLRTMTPIALVCWFAWSGRLHVEGTWAAWTANLAAVVIFTLCALGEYVGDKLPRTPNRTAPGPLAARILFGGLVGAIIAASLHLPLAVAIAIGSIAAIAGAFGGYHVRRFLTVDCKLPDLPIALVEDLVGIGLCVLALSRLTS